MHNSAGDLGNEILSTVRKYVIIIILAQRKRLIKTVTYIIR